MKRKIKLRDLTAKKWDENNFNICKSCSSCSDCMFKWVVCAKSNFENSWVNHKEIYNDKFLSQEIEIEEPDILEEVEKEYLSAIIKPFRNRVISVKKVECSNNSYFINIKVISELSPSRTENIFLPYFQNEMYKGMESNKEYTLKDLDL